MACISAETGTLVFAIINLILVCGWSFLGILTLTLLGVALSHNHDKETIALQLNGVAEILILLSLSLVTLLFSSFLMNGILKKKPQHIKAYYIFGILTEVLTFLALIIMFSSGVRIAGYFYGIIFALYIVYSLILYMIRCTYIQIEMDQNQFGHQRLQVTC